METGRFGTGINLGLWDPKAVAVTHNSFKEDDGTLHAFYADDETEEVGDHATHVAGTIIADGDNEMATGMAKKSKLYSYRSANDIFEMTECAANRDLNFPEAMILSNHSYGSALGWSKSGETWYWNAGRYELVDPLFGDYTDFTKFYDNIAFGAPYYTIVQAVGNDRGEEPDPGTSHLVYENDIWVSCDRWHSADGENGYRCIPIDAVAKNTLTVGAVDDINNGYTSPLDVKQQYTYFSSSGPTSDGRIKPDIVANGDLLFSTIPAPAFFADMSGTSMAAFHSGCRSFNYIK